MTDEVDELSKSLFAVKMAQSNPTKMAGCVNYLPWEFLIKAEFGKGGIYDRFINVGEYLCWNSAGGEGIRDGWQVAGKVGNSCFRSGEGTSADCSGVK